VNSVLAGLLLLFFFRYQVIETSISLLLHGKDKIAEHLTS